MGEEVLAETGRERNAELLRSLADAMADPLRGRILAQLLGIRGQLDSVPAMLASVNREAELLDNVGADTDSETESDAATEPTDDDEVPETAPATS